MEIKTRGARANHGWMTVVPKGEFSINWDKESRSIRLSVSNVPSRNKKVKHHYAVSLSIGDVQKIVGTLARKEYKIPKTK